MKKKKDEYEFIYDNGDDSGIDYSDSSECDPEEAVAGLRGNVSSGSCLYCGAHNGMKYEGNICFICSVCGRSIHEDLYYRWMAGYEIEMDDDDYDDIY